MAAFVGTSTVTQTIPAGGIMGWFGATTTTTVGLVTAQPWLVPVVTAYGLISIGTPLWVMKKARNRWEDITNSLNDEFWMNWADVDVFVQAILSCHKDKNCI